MKKLISILKQRWKFYMIGYVFGYIFPIAVDGTIDLYHLFPIKVVPVLFALILGTSAYYATNRVSILMVYIKLLKYALIVMVLIAITGILQKYLMLKGMNISMFVGWPKKG